MNKATDLFFPIRDIISTGLLHGIREYSSLVIHHNLLKDGGKFALGTLLLEKLLCQVQQVFSEEVFSLLSHGQKLNFLTLEGFRGDEILDHFIPMLLRRGLKLNKSVEAADVEKARIY